MAVGNFDGTSFDGSIGGFDVDSTADTHDGWKQRTTERGAGFDDEKHEERKGRQAHLRDLLEAAFAPEAPAPVATEVREAAAPVVKRMESGAIDVDWAALAERQALESRLYALRDAFWREQAEIEDDEDALMLTGSLH